MLTTGVVKFFKLFLRYQVKVARPYKKWKPPSALLLGQLTNCENRFLIVLPVGSGRGTDISAIRHWNKMAVYKVTWGTR
jgi:hypothetical protein